MRERISHAGACAAVILAVALGFALPHVSQAAPVSGLLEYIGGPVICEGPCPSPSEVCCWPE